MMTKNRIIILSFSVLLLISLLIYHFIFSIYEVTYKISNNKLYADAESEVKIEAIPINSFGRQAPFRKAKTKFKVIEGSSLIEIVEIDEFNGKIILKTKKKTGTIVIQVNSKYAILPSEISINIYPNAV